MKGMKKICGSLLCLALLMGCLGSLAKLGTDAERAASLENGGRSGETQSSAAEEIQGTSDEGK